MPLDGCPGIEVRTVISLVFSHHAVRNRLRAFKLRTGIKMAAMLATTQIGLALRALAVGGEFCGGMNQVAAHGTPHDLLKAGHTRRPGAVHRPPRPLLLGSLPRAGSLAVALLVTLRIVFSSHDFLSAPILRESVGDERDSKGESNDHFDGRRLQTFHYIPVSGLS